jgi:hypothetical protein
VLETAYHFAGFSQRTLNDVQLTQELRPISVNLFRMFFVETPTKSSS